VDRVEEEHVYDELKRLRKNNNRLKEGHDIPKKGGNVLYKGKLVKYAFINRNQESNPHAE